MTDPMTPTPDLAALVEEVLADEGWCCDPYGHEDGPPAVGECSECDRMRGDAAAVLVSRLGPVLDGVRAEAWDEGWVAGCNDQQYGDENARPWTPNPYRAGTAARPESAHAGDDVLLEAGESPPVTLLGGLLGDLKAGADLGPSGPVSAGLLDKGMDSEVQETSFAVEGGDVVESGHASSLVDDTLRCQDGLTHAARPETTEGER